MERKELLLHIKKAQKRIFLCKLCQILLGSLGIGFGLGILVNGISLFVPIYAAQKMALGAVLLFLALGGCYGLFRFPNKEQAAQKMDQTGLSERVSTALEQIEEDSAISQLQRQDTLEHLQRFSLKESFPIKIDARKCLVVFGLCSLFAATALLPSKARQEAVRQHELKEEIKAEAKKAEELKKLLDTDKALQKALEPAKRAELQSQLAKAAKELAKAKSKQELLKAKTRLEKKVSKALEGMNAQELSQEAANLLKNYLPELEGQLKLAENGSSEEGMEGSAQESNGNNSNNSNNSNNNSNNGNSQSGSGSQSDGQNNGQNNGENNSQNGNGQGNSGNNGSNGNQQNGSGNGQSGNGSGENGSGNGNGGQGRGLGGGYNYGSKQGVEKTDVSNRGEPEKVTIPGRQVGNDENVTGTGSKGASQHMKGTQSDGYKGEEVDYGSVLGEYSQAAYDRLNGGGIPAGMENIVKNYFDGLNE